MQIAVVVVVYLNKTQKSILQVATVPKSTMVQGKTTVTAGGSPQIIQTSSGAAMATAVVGAGGDKKISY